MVGQLEHGIRACAVFSCSIYTSTYGEPLVSTFSMAEEVTGIIPAPAMATCCASSSINFIKVQAASFLLLVEVMTMSSPPTMEMLRPSTEGISAGV